MRTTLPLLALTPLARAAINWDVFQYGVVPSFRWSRPFPDDGTDPGGFTVNCRASGSFEARQYKLKDLADEPPAGLAPWRTAIEDFLRRRDYAGSWDGVDHKGQDREIVVMEWTDVPSPVRDWIKEQQRDEREANDKKWLFGVFAKPKAEGEKVFGTVKPKPTGAAAASPGQGGQGEQEGQQQQQQQQQQVQEQVPDIADEDKIVVFPAGAIYEILPLWVSKGSGCERKHN